METFEDHENAYSGLLQDTAEGHWAFGTGFDDPLAGVDTTIPDGVDPAEVSAICLALADDGLIHAQRLTEWLTHGPEIEEEIALANIGLDLIGQARLLYARAAAATPDLLDGLPGAPVSPEDALAYFRGPDGFRNVTLAELPRGDFAFTMVRLRALSGWRLTELAGLSSHRDPVLSAIAARAVKEVDYHRDHAARWVDILIDGTEESQRRVADAHAEVEPWLAELRGDPGTAYDGRTGRHTPHLTELLGTLQQIARAHPQGVW